MRIIVVDDHELAHAGLRMLCAAREDLAIVASFTLAREALAWLEENAADIVVLDLDLPDLAGPAALAEMLGGGPRKVVILTGANSGEVLRTCLDLGAIAVVSKGDPVECTLHAIDSAHEDRRYVSPTAEKLMGGLGEPPIVLPPRQLAILQLVAGGVSNKEIAYRLGIAAPTVSFHLAELRRRLGVDSNRQLVNRAVSIGLVISSAT